MAKRKFCRKRLRSPKAFAKSSLRTKKVRKGVRVIVGCPKGKYSRKAKRCKVGTKAQSVLKRKRNSCPRGYSLR